jgi:hypothetical protein
MFGGFVFFLVVKRIASKQLDKGDADAGYRVDVASSGAWIMLLLTLVACTAIFLPLPPEPDMLARALITRVLYITVGVILVRLVGKLRAREAESRREREEMYKKQALEEIIESSETER